MAVGVAASGLALGVTGTLTMVRLSQAAQNSAQFDTGQFLRGFDMVATAAMGMAGLFAFAFCLRHGRKKTMGQA